MACTPIALPIHTSIYIFLVFALISSLTTALPMGSASKGKIGVDYGLNGDNLPTPEQTVKLLCSKGIKRVRSYEARPYVTAAFANSGIDLMISIRNEEVPKVAASVVEAFFWVNKYVVPFPTSGISAILVGNEWLSNSSNDPNLLVPAMQNVHTALSTLQFFHIYLSGIKVSTSHSFDLLSKPSFPPSTATFAKEFVEVIQSVLNFLDDTGSFFMVNIFPYFSYLADKGVSLEFALFTSTEVVTDSITGLKYTNLFDLQLDAVYAAIDALPVSLPTSSSPCAGNNSKVTTASDNYVHGEAANGKGRSPLQRSSRQRPLQVGETGWSSGKGSADTPPGGGHGGHRPILPSFLSSSGSSLTATMSTPAKEKERAAYAATAVEEKARCSCDAETVENARTYNQNLIRHVLQAEGTPANPTTPIQAYIFALYEENLKPAGAEQHFGLFYPNGTAVYPINFHEGGK